MQPLGQGHQSMKPFSGRHSWANLVGEQSRILVSFAALRSFVRHHAPMAGIGIRTGIEMVPPVLQLELPRLVGLTSIGQDHLGAWGCRSKKAMVGPAAMMSPARVHQLHHNSMGSNESRDNRFRGIKQPYSEVSLRLATRPAHSKSRSV